MAVSSLLSFVMILKSWIHRGIPLFLFCCINLHFFHPFHTSVHHIYCLIHTLIWYTQTNKMACVLYWNLYQSANCWTSWAIMTSLAAFFYFPKLTHIRKTVYMSGQNGYWSNDMSYIDTFVGFSLQKCLAEFFEYRSANSRQWTGCPACCSQRCFLLNTFA